MPTLETPEDRRREEIVVKALCALNPDWEITKTAEKEHTDRWVWSRATGNLLQPTEIRTRWGSYIPYIEEGLIVPLRKYFHLVSMARELSSWGIEVHYVTAWDDFFGTASVTDFVGYPIYRGGRRGRGLLNDLEPMILVPFSVFESFPIPEEWF
jgi:hypothetical protein